MSACEELPPAKFNPTIFSDELDGWRHRVRVYCWGQEIAYVQFDPRTRPARDWARVVIRWARMMIDREFRRWEERSRIKRGSR